MFDPKFRLTHTILNNIVKFEVESKGIKNLDLNDEVKGKSRLYASSLDIFHLAHTFGINITLKTARKVASGKTLNIDDYKSWYLTNFRNAMEYVFSTQTAYYPVQGNILIHLNKILIKNIAEDWDAKFRTGGEQINTRDDNWVELSNKKVNASEVQANAQDVLTWFSTMVSKIHPLIAIPAAVYELVRITPFVTGNKATIISISKYLFYKSGMLLSGYLPVVKNIDVYEQEYVESWQQAIQQEEDITLWIERFTRNISQEALNTREKIEKFADDYKEKHKQPFLGLNRRQLKILRYLQNIPEIKREEYVQMMEVSTMTAYRDLTELVKKRLIRVEGEGRGTRYLLASR